MATNIVQKKSSKGGFRLQGRLCRQGACGGVDGEGREKCQ